jgi:hypothetical protein
MGAFVFMPTIFLGVPTLAYIRGRLKSEIGTA